MDYKRKLLTISGLLLSTQLYAFESFGSITTSLHNPDLMDDLATSSAGFRTTADFNFKGEMFSKNVKFHFGLDYSNTWSDSESYETTSGITNYLNIDSKEENDGVNIHDINLEYSDSLFSNDLKYAFKIGRFTNNLPYSNYYRKDKSFTGVNHTWLSGLIGQAVWKKETSIYGSYFNEMNSHVIDLEKDNDLSESQKVEGYFIGVSNKNKYFSTTLNNLFVNYEEKNKLSLNSSLLQFDTTIFNNELTLDYLLNTYSNSTLSEDVSSYGVTNRIDLKIPVTLKYTFLSQVQSNFDSSFESPIRSINSNTMRSFIYNSVHYSQLLSEGTISSSEYIDKTTDLTHYGVSLDFSKIFKKDTRDFFSIDFDSFDSDTLLRINYNDKYFNSFDVNLNFGQEMVLPSNNSEEVEESKKITDFTIRGTIDYKF